MHKVPAGLGVASALGGVGVDVSGVTSLPLAVCLWVIAAALAVYSIRDSLVIPYWLRLPLPFGLIPLPEASRMVYEEVRSGYWGGAAEAFGGSPDGVLEYLSIPISERTTIYGRRPPSIKMEPISRAHIKAGMFVNGAKSHARRDDLRTIEYVDLSIKRSALGGIIQSMKPNEEANA